MSNISTTEKNEYIVKNWENVNCPFCGLDKHKSHEKFGANHRYSYVQCLNCKLVYLNPRPKYDDEFVETAYAGYADSSHYIANNGQLSAHEKDIVEEYSIILKKIMGHLKPKASGKYKLLEIGCADGKFLLAGKKLGFDVVGVDVTKKAIDGINQFLGLKAYCEQYQKLDLSSDGPFDLIYCSHVIEHIPNTSEWMEKFKKDLAPDGILCINVPNQFAIDKVFKRFLKNIGLKKDKWHPSRTPDHFYEPHSESMFYLFNKHGFNVIDNYTYSKNEKVKETISEKIYHHQLKLAAKQRYIVNLKK